MKSNMGKMDRVLRAVVGVLLLAAFALDGLTGALGILALIVGIALLGTAALGYCPPYALLGINTCGTHAKKPAA